MSIIESASQYGSTGRMWIAFQNMAPTMDLRMRKVVLNSMPVLESRQVFGHAGGRGINVRLQTCSVTVSLYLINPHLWLTSS